MGKRIRLTPTLIDKVWVLYNQGFDELKICNKLGISRASVTRCIYAMQKAASGTFVEYTGLLKDSHHIADYANNKFQLSAEPSKNEEANKPDLIEVMQAFTENLHQWNTLFATLLKKLERP